MPIRQNFKGDKEIAAALAAIPLEMAEKVIPLALRAAGRAVISKARQLVPVEKPEGGLLKKSLGLFLRGKKGRPQYVVMGARVGKQFEGIINGVKHAPANYAHLVELGHMSVIPKAGAQLRKGSAVLSGRRHVAAKPYLGPALDGSRAEVKQLLITNLKEGQEKIISRLLRK